MRRTITVSLVTAAILSTASLFSLPGLFYWLGRESLYFKASQYFQWLGLIAAECVFPCMKTGEFVGCEPYRWGPIVIASNTLIFFAVLLPAVYAVRKFSGPRRVWIRRASELFLSLYLALTIGTGVFSWSFAPTDHPTVLQYYIARSSFRILDWVHAGPANARELMANPENVWSFFQVAYVLSVVCLALVLWQIIRTISQSRHEHLLRGWYVGVLVLLAFPVVFAVATFSSWGSRDFGRGNGIYLQSPRWILTAAELVGIALLYLSFRKRRISGVLKVVLIAVHCVLWILITAADLARRQVIDGPLLLLVFPCTVFLWFCSSDPSGSKTQRQLSRRDLAFRGILAAIPLVILVAIWTPVPRRNVASFLVSEDEAPAIILMTRTGCFGSCPVYHLKVQMDGQVEYSGNIYVRKEGPFTTAVPPSQVKRVVQRLDEIGFSSLEDRAFVWCYDTPYVTLTVASRNWRKSVRSDAFCIGSPAGPQAKFVQLTRDIDKMVNSDQWTIR
jgi:hypothetical protein